MPPAESTAFSPRPDTSAWQAVCDAATELANDALLRTADSAAAGDDTDAVAVLMILQTAHRLMSLAGEAMDKGVPVLKTRGALRFREPVIAISPAPEHAGASLRAVPDLPAGRAEHLLPYQRPFQERAHGERRSPWDLAAARTLPARHRWLLAAAVCLAGMVISAVSTALLRDWKAPVTILQTAPAHSVIERTDGDVFASRSRIEQAVRAFHAATTPEARAALVRHGTRLLPLLQSYYATHPMESPVSEIHPDTYNWVEFQGGTLVYGLLTGEDGVARQFTVQLSADSCLLDWQSLTGWTGVDWETCLQQRPADPVTLCVSAAPDSLYSGLYDDGGKWICLKIEDPDRSHHAWAYVRRGSAAAKALPASFLADAGTLAGQTLRPAPRRLTLSLRFPPAGEAEHPYTPLLLEVTAVRHEGWFNPDPGGLSE